MLQRCFGSCARRRRRRRAADVVGDGPISSNALHVKWKAEEQQKQAGSAASQSEALTELPPLPRLSCKYPYQLNMEEKANMRRLFSVFDEDGSDQVSLKELAAGFGKLGM